MRVGIIGASGYTGAELLRLCAAHPEFEVVYATGDTSAGQRAADLYPSVAAADPSLTFETYDPAATQNLDPALPAPPHRASQAIGPQVRKPGAQIPDPAPHLP